MSVEIREPTADDAEAIGRMHHASWAEAYSALLPPEFWDGFRPESRVALWRRLLEHRRPEQLAAVALVDDEVVGVASHQGTGIAQRLLEEVLPSGTPAQLWVFEQNPRARRFYERNGFAPDGARHVFGPELGGQPEIRLIRS